MHEMGDDLDAPRVVEFHFVFPERIQSLKFIEAVDDRELAVCVSYYEEQNMWQTTVTRFMVPTHGDITGTELFLTEKARAVGGEPDGWGCMSVKKTH